MNPKLKAEQFVKMYPNFFKRDWDWFSDNWHIVLKFEDEALDLIYAGRDHYSARTIVEVLVHNSILYEQSGGQYKIGNDNAPDLARIFVVLHPEYVNFWEYRRPDNKEFKRVVSELLF